MELWHLNIIAVLVIAVITRKDMAVIVGASMVFGYLVTLGDYSQLQASLMFCGLNALLAIVASAYNRIKQCNISMATASLSAIASCTNLVQMYDTTLITSTITAILGWGLVLTLFFMDGDKGLINGFMGDARACYRRFVYNLSHDNNNKGAH